LRLISVDRVPKETLQSWLKTISLPTFFFKSVLPAARASTSTQHIEPTVVLGRDELLGYLSTIKPAEKDADLAVALMGLPNVGKTSVLNSLLPAKAKHHETAPVLALNAASKNPEPTTKMASETRIEYNGKSIRIIDTPGWDFADDDEEEEEEEEDDEDEDAEVDEEKLAKWDQLEQTMTGDLLRRNLGRVDRIKDIIPLGKSAAFVSVSILTGSQLHHLEIECSRSHGRLQHSLFQ
jgi:nuclear GTP-binding protein